MRKTYFLVVGLLANLALADKALAQQELPCDMYLRSAKIYLKQSVPDLESALKNLLAAPEKCRLTGEIDFMIGSIYADKNVYDKMVEYFNIALKKDPSLQKKIKDIKESKWSEVFKKGAQFLEKANQVGSIMQYSETAITHDSSRKKIVESLNAAQRVDPSLEPQIKKILESKWNDVWKVAVELLEKSSHRQALKSFETAIMIDSSRYEAYYNAGIEALNLDSSSKATLLLEKAYKTVPENLNVKTVYARVILNQNKFQEASKLYEEIVKQDPKNKEALINLARSEEH